MQEKNHLVFWNIFSAFSLPGRQGPRFSFTRPTALTLQISYTEFLRLHLKYGIVFVEIIKMPLQDLFVGLFLLLQRFDLQQPTTDDCLGRAACIDEMLDAFLVLLNIALVVDIKFLGHFLTLAFIVRDKHGITHH